MKDEKTPNEQYANWEAPGTENKSEAEIQEKIKERLDQSFSSRLCEYITGIKPSDPRMAERLITDQQIIRAKYNLPNPHLSPSEFERSLKNALGKVGARIKPASECGKFFEEERFAGAVNFGDGIIGVDINRSTLDKYWVSLNRLEHETVHALQNVHSSSMPIELMEYEAYVANANVEYFKKDPEAVDDVFFNFFVGISVNYYYRALSKERGKKIKPVWDNPAYFLKLDGVDSKTIRAAIKTRKRDSKKHPSLNAENQK